MRFEVFTAMKIYILLFWVMRPRSLVGGYQYFEGIWFPLRQDSIWRQQVLLNVVATLCPNSEDNLKIILTLCSQEIMPYIDTMNRYRYRTHFPNISYQVTNVLDC
jgi:hypothetical protein